MLPSGEQKRHAAPSARMAPVQVARAMLATGRHDGAPDDHYSLVLTEAPTSFIRSSPLRKHYCDVGRSFCCLRRPGVEVPIEIVAPSASVSFVQISGTWLQERFDEVGSSLLKAESLVETIDPAIVLLAARIGRASDGQHASLGREELHEALLQHLVGRYGDSREMVSDLSVARTRAVTDYIDQHLADTLSLDDLASVAGSRRFGFARLFTLKMGISPHRYVMARRAAAAVRLIHQQRMPLSEIAATVGFYDQAHMSRWISREIGLTPTQVARASFPSLAEDGGTFSGRSEGAARPVATAE